MRLPRTLFAVLALLTVGHEATARDAYVGAGVGRHNWTCNSNSHETCPLESHTDTVRHAEALAGVRWPVLGRLSLGAEAAVTARRMKAHGRNYPAGADVEGRFKADLGSIATQFNRDGFNTTAVARGVAEVRLLGPVYAGPYVGLGAGLFRLAGDTAVAPVVEVGGGLRVRLSDRWSLTGRYGLVHALRTTNLAGRPLSYTAHGPTAGLAYSF